MVLVCHVILQDHIIKLSCDLWARDGQGKLLPCQVGGHRQYFSGDVFSLSRYLARPCDQRVM